MADILSSEEANAVPLGDLLSRHEWFTHNTLIHVFQYLEAKDLLKASEVCKLWNQIASDRSLWRSVTVNDCRLHWTPMGHALSKNETTHLRLIDCIFMLNTDYLINALKNIPTLRRIEFSECSSMFVERLPQATTKLEEINLNLIGGFGVHLDLEFMAKLPKLYKVSLNCNREITSLIPLLYLRNTLKYLSLMDVQNLLVLELDMLSMLKNLEHLALGNCWNLPQYFSDTILNMAKMKSLSLHACRECNLNSIIRAASQVKTLQKLELIGINVDEGLYEILPLCKNLKKLSVVPNARRLKSADGNTQVVDGVFKLKDTLTSFTLGFSEFYLRYVERNEEIKDSAPFLLDKKTYPDTIIQELFESDLLKSEEVVPLRRVHEFLSRKMPKVKVRVVEWKPKWPYVNYIEFHN